MHSGISIELFDMIYDFFLGGLIVKVYPKAFYSNLITTHLLVPHISL